MAPHGFKVYCSDGPAAGWGYITFVEPDVRIAVAPKPFESSFDKWMRVVLEDPLPEGTVIYERDTEFIGAHLTEEGDWLAPYTVVADA